MKIPKVETDDTIASYAVKLGYKVYIVERGEEVGIRDIWEGKLVSRERVFREKKREAN